MGQEVNKDRVISLLNRILEHELAGVVRYTHYSFMVFGFNRIPISGWLRQAAADGMLHAHEAGEMITRLGEHPSLGIGELLETHKHDVKDILLEAYEFEKEGIGVYKDLLEETRDKSIVLEEYSRKLIADEETHLDAINKMLRTPGDVKKFSL